MKRLLLFLGILMMSVTVQAGPVKLLVLGDSLSVGHNLATRDSFWAQLGAALKKKGENVQVLNYSKSGETTAGGLKKVGAAMTRHPDGVLVQLGSNDAFQKVPVKETTKNLTAIVEKFQQAGIPVLLIGMVAPMDMPQEYRDAFEKMYVEVATEHDTLLYPFFMAGLWKEDGGHVSEDCFLSDGIHPSAKGVQIMVQNITPAILQFLQEDVLPRKIEKEKTT